MRRSGLDPPELASTCAPLAFSVAAKRSARSAEVDIADVISLALIPNDVANYCCLTINLERRTQHKDSEVCAACKVQLFWFSLYSFYKLDYNKKAIL